MKNILLLTTIALISASSSANANVNDAEKKEVENAFAEWRKQLSSGKAENIVNLYDKDAVLLATLADEPITNQKDRTDYFKTLTAKPKLAVELQKEYIKLLDENTAAVSGTYTFSFEQDGKKVEVPARYSFVFEKQNGKWLIEEHHSSKLPNQK